MYKLAGTWSHESDVKAVRFTPAGVLAAGRDCKLRLHTKNASTVLFEDSSYLNSLAVAGNSAFIGDQDATIVAIDLATKAEVYYLGHSANVCALDASESLLVSGSWDKTARIWTSPASSVELVGHSEAVWAVLIVDPTHILTASADKTIILWENAQIKRKFTGHTDAVRGLCLLDGGRFASCSNDGTVKIWSLEGALLHTLEGHSSFVYSVAFHNGLLFSSGEDRTLRVWQETQLVQSIVLPGISVWSVATSKSGTVAVGSSDHKVRLFSIKRDEWLSQAERDAFEQEVAQTSVGEDQVQFDEKQLQPASILQTNGKEGQVVMVRSQDTVHAHQYSGGKWQLIGEVVGQKKQKKEFEGSQYDYVFDVDVADGMPALKLPFNDGDNVYTAAEKFVEENQLPVSYVGQVADFLIKNTQAAPSKPAAQPTKPIPSSTSSASPGSSTKLSTNSLIASYNKPVLMTNFSKEQLAKAFAEKANDQGSVQVELLPMLESLPDSADELLETAQSALSHWNPTNFLPALDALRLAVAYTKTSPGLPTLLSFLSCIDPAMPKFATLATRGLVNIAARPDGRKLVEANQQIFREALTLLEKADEMPGGLALAAATLILNLAVIETSLSIAKLSVRLTELVSGNEEAKYRLALAIGVLAFRHPSDRPVLLEAKNWLENDPSPRFKQIASEINSLQN